MPSRADDVQAKSFVSQADALFVARRYREADKLYREARRTVSELPRNARDRWAYCQLARVVEDLNRQPNTPDEWASIQTEIRCILNLVPNNEYALALLKTAEQRGRSTVALAPGDKAVIRANEPDKPDPKPTSLLAGLATRIGLACKEDPGKRSMWQRFRSGPWQVLETSNFRVHHMDESIAGPVADMAESTRIELYRTWFGHLPESNWNPKCDIFIHNSADAYARTTGQGQASPGHSATGIDRGQITSRRIDLRRDGLDLIHAVLPHEITHVVMADRFTHRPLPRWADEGMAVLTEPSEKKQAHLRNLGDLSQRSRLYSARQLMTMGEYPPGDMWGMFYAESVSLVEFLVNRAGPGQFVEFMAGSQESNYESELKRVYGFASFDALDREWSRGRVEQVASATAR